MSSSPRRPLRAAAIGALAALALWLAAILPAALRLLHGIEPIAAPGALAPVQPARDPARQTAAVLASQAGTEVTDFLAPYAILAASGAFDVYAVAVAPEPAPTNGGLGIVPHATLADFDAAHPGGADLVIVPNVLDPESPVLVDWLRRQAERGAAIASICEGARLLARTGLLDGRSATTHFAAIGELAEAFPKVRWRNDVRYVADDRFVTSAGVSAAVDAALHLVGSLAGAEARARAARTLGLTPRDDPHSPAPVLGAGDLAIGALNALFVWPKRRVAIPLEDGVDEIELAARVDAYPRTFAAASATVAPSRRPALSRHGLLLVPARAAETVGPDELVAAPVRRAGEVGSAFDSVLRDIAAVFGGATAELVADQLQYPASHLGLDAAPSGVAAGLLRLAAVLGAGAAIGLAIDSVRRRRARPAGAAYGYVARR